MSYVSRVKFHHLSGFTEDNSGEALIILSHSYFPFVTTAGLVNALYVMDELTVTIDLFSL